MKWFVVAFAIMQLALVVVSASAGAGTGASFINLIGEQTRISVESPFQVSPGAVDTFIAQDGVIYPGEKIFIVPVKITNIGRMPYSVNISPRITDGTWPNFDLRIMGKNITPNQLAIIKPGETIELIIDISVGYGSPNASFRGLALDVFPGTAEPSSYPGKG